MSTFEFSKQRLVDLLSIPLFALHNKAFSSDIVQVKLSVAGILGHERQYNYQVMDIHAGEQPAILSRCVNKDIHPLGARFARSLS